jgi:hypothetical protein
MTTSTLLKAAQAALDALCLPCDRWNGTQARIVNAAIDALRAAIAAQPAPDAGPVAEWQARVGPRGQWKRVDPPPGVTVDQRVAELRGYPRYEFRALYAAPIAQQAAAAPTKWPLTSDYKLTMYGHAMLRPKAGPMTSICWYVAGIEDAEAAHGIRG